MGLAQLTDRFRSCRLITVPWLAAQFTDLASFAPLADGGQKWVFSAQHPTDGDVVLKLIKPSSDGGERVRREILAVQQIRSARVPKVIAAGVLKSPLGEFVWVREQRIAGSSVRQVLQGGAMSIDDVVRLGLHVLEALNDADHARIVHRDVKPDNVMLGSDSSFWLLDFGIARHLDLTSLTATAAMGGVGTLGYAPPEQFRNHKREIDGRADLFALGVTMLECLTGKHPYRDGARDRIEVLRRIESAPLVIPAIPGPNGGKVRDILAALTQRRLDCRPDSIREALSWMTEIGGRA
jgi:eukaryotic-like serine/threonine-protein kinase